MFFVREKGKEERQKLIGFLENNGYELDQYEPRSKNEICDDFLPIVINPLEKKYRMMGNVTCAAAAVSSGKMITAQEFYDLFTP